MARVGDQAVQQLVRGLGCEPGLFRLDHAVEELLDHVEHLPSRHGVLEDRGIDGVGEAEGRRP
jgi:hypothetical protein